VIAASNSAARHRTGDGPRIFVTSGLGSVKTEDVRSVLAPVDETMRRACRRTFPTAPCSIVIDGRLALLAAVLTATRSDTQCPGFAS
jgi:hypothetical protein